MQSEAKATFALYSTNHHESKGEYASKVKAYHLSQTVHRMYDPKMTKDNPPDHNAVLTIIQNDHTLPNSILEHRLNCQIERRGGENQTDTMVVEYVSVNKETYEESLNVCQSGVGGLLGLIGRMSKANSGDTGAFGIPWLRVSFLHSDNSISERILLQSDDTLSYRKRRDMLIHELRRDPMGFYHTKEVASIVSGEVIASKVERVIISSNPQSGLIKVSSGEQASIRRFSKAEVKERSDKWWAAHGLGSLRGREYSAINSVNLGRLLSGETKASLDTQVTDTKLIPDASPSHMPSTKQSRNITTVFSNQGEEKLSNSSMLSSDHKTQVYKAAAKTITSKSVWGNQSRLAAVKATSGALIRESGASNESGAREIVIDMRRSGGSAKPPSTAPPVSSSIMEDING